MSGAIKNFKGTRGAKLSWKSEVRLPANLPYTVLQWRRKFEANVAKSLKLRVRKSWQKILAVRQPFYQRGTDVWSTYLIRWTHRRDCSHTKYTNLVITRAISHINPPAKFAARQSASFPKSSDPDRRHAGLSRQDGALDAEDLFCATSVPMSTRHWEASRKSKRRYGATRRGLMRARMRVSSPRA